MELRILVDMLLEDGQIQAVIGDPLAQFGTDRRRYLGATLMPERFKRNSNIFKEEFIRYRSPIGRHATRFSPPQIQGGASMEV